MISNKKIGPLSKKDLLDLVGKDQIALNDSIYDTRSCKWTKIYEHPDFLRGEAELKNSTQVVRSLENTTILSPKTAAAKTILTSSFSGVTKTSGGTPQTDSNTLNPYAKWFYKSGTLTRGPFNTLQFLTLYNNGEIKSGDLVKSDIAPDFKMFRSYFSNELLEQLKVLEPVPSQGSHPNTMALNQLISVLNKANVQHIAYGISVSDSTLHFCITNAFFQTNEEITCLLQSSRGVLVPITGIIAEQGTIKNKSEGFPIAKYSVKLATAFNFSAL